MHQRERLIGETAVCCRFLTGSKVFRKYARSAASLQLCILALLVAFLSHVAVAQEPSPSAAITGRLIDAQGSVVPHATILLTGAASQRATSDSTGAFAFRALAPGRYRLSAGHTDSDWIDLAAGATSHIELKLGNPPAASSPALSQAMQFADDPHFTIAGITDWTAAGGHGSDANLRASEALTRDTLDLQPNDGLASPSTCPQDEAAVRAAVATQPHSFEAMHCLGIFDLRNRNYAGAVKSLEDAYHLRPSDSENQYALAKASEKAGDAAGAQQHLQSLAAGHNAADLHRLAGQLDESLGDPVAAVHEFAQAVHQDPSEPNYFAWGSELLYHRAVWQARDVFQEGVRAWPKSTRMLTALGAALFAGALYDEAAERLCQAATLDPQNPEPYLFMGRIEVAAPHPLPCVAPKLAEFHRRFPGNALADYYLAMALSKQQPPSANSSTQQQIVDLLHQAVTADPACGEAWLQLGILQAQSGNYAAAIPLYTKALHSRPQLTEAYYRLGVAYDRTGQRDKAQEALAKHDSLEKQQAAEVQKQRQEIKQFVISSADANTSTRNSHD
ncbi:MAG: tetratricopeptide repeat protein [Acidobacteriota bacterium]